MCEFCGDQEQEVEGTSFCGAYCVKCHRLNIAESREAIKEIKKRILKQKNEILNPLLIHREKRNWR